MNALVKKEEQARTALVALHANYTKELKEVQQKEIEMSAGDSLGETGIKTAMYHSKLVLSLKQISDVIQTIEANKYWRK